MKRVIMTRDYEAEAWEEYQKMRAKAIEDPPAKSMIGPLLEFILGLVIAAICIIVLALREGK